MNAKPITTLFLDIGGVLLTNGWGRAERQNAVDHFDLDAAEINERHHLTFDTYESGKLTLDEYLDRVVFYEPRSFGRATFQSFMFAQSQALEGALAFFKMVKAQNKLRVVAVSNEGRELNAYRIQQFRLSELFDAFVSSSFVHLRKPDLDIFRMACDIAQAEPQEVLYMDDRLMFVQVAGTLGIHAHHYQGLENAKLHLQALGFQLNIT